MQNISLDSKAKEDDMQDAFQDLEALMVRAGEMVRLAQSLSAKLATPASEDESLIRSSLVQLGLPVPALTLDMARSQEEYHRGLAVELGGILEALMMGPKGRGMIGLDEVWGLWMRARGVGKCFFAEEHCCS
jgi:ESCRT-II complex subunit VPS36